MFSRKQLRESYWARSGSFAVGERFLLQIFRSVAFVVLVRALPGKAEFGIWALFLTVAAFVEVSRTGLIQNGLIRALAVAEKEEHGRISTASLALHVIATGLCVGALLFGAALVRSAWDAAELGAMLELYAVTTIVLIPFFHFNFVQQANLDFRGTFFSNVVREGLFCGYVVAGWIAGASVDLIALARFQIVAAAVGAFVAFLFARPSLRFSRSVDREALASLFRYGKYVMGTGLSSMLIKSIDHFMLMALIPVSPAAAVASYSVAVKISNLVEIPTQAAAAVVFPKSARHSSSDGADAIRALYEKSVGLVLALIAPGVLLTLVVPELVLRVIAGEAYADSAAILQIVVLSVLFLPFARQFGTVMDSTRSPRINFGFVLLGAVANGVSNYLFIRSFGVIGAAYGTLTSIVLVFVLNQVVLNRSFGITPLSPVLHAAGLYQRGWAILTRAAGGNRPAAS